MLEHNASGFILSAAYAVRCFLVALPVFDVCLTESLLLNCQTRHIEYALCLVGISPAGAYKINSVL